MAGRKKHGKEGKRRRHRIGGFASDDLLPMMLPAVGIIGAHELKGMLPATLATSLGTNYGLVINGVGVLAGLGLPMLIKSPGAKMYVKGIGAGIAGQCLYSLFVQYVSKTTPPVINRTWSSYGLAGKAGTYALGGKHGTYALGCVQNPDGSQSFTMVPNTSANKTVMTPAGNVINPNPNLATVQAVTQTVQKSTAGAANVSKRRMIGGM